MLSLQKTILESEFTNSVLPAVQQGMDQAKELVADIFAGFSLREIVIMPVKEFAAKIYIDMMGVLVETVGKVSAAAEGNELFLSLVMKLKEAGKVAGDIVVSIVIVPYVIAVIIMFGGQGGFFLKSILECLI